MTKTTDIQLRGHCPKCGALQAATNGHLAHHGYTVKWNQFQGPCSGHGYAPIELNRIEADKTVVMLRELSAEKAELARALRAGEKHPTTVKGHWDIDAKAYRDVPWDEARPYQREAAVNMLVSGNESMARHLADDADRMAALIERVHGQPLVEVKKAEKPAPVLRGEQRKSGSGKVLTATRVEGARVYWSVTRDDGKVFTGWTGTQAWRRFELAPKVEA